MIYTVYINDQLKKVSAINLVEKIDKTLDYGSIQFRDQQAASYRGYVDIGVSDGVNTKWYYFLISGDDSQFLRDGFYLHKVDLVELTYLLNEFTESTRVLTQTDPPESAYETMLKWQHTIPFTRFEDLETSRAFIWDDATENYFRNVSLPEMKLDRKNLHEMLQEAFEYFDAIPRLTKVNNYLVLKADFVNRIGNLIDPDRIGEMERFNINEYGTNLDLHLENLYDRRTSVVEPSPNGFKPLDGKDGLYKEDTAFINTEFPILDVEELVVRVEVQPEGMTVQEYELDLKSYILEKNQWELLTDAPSFGNPLGTFRDNTLFFTRYQRGVDGLFDEVGAWRGVSIINADIRLRRVIYKALADLDVVIPGRVRISDFTKVRVRIKYKALVNSRVSVQKDDVSELDRKASLYSNQSDQVVDSELVLDNNYKRIQQMGNPEYYFVNREKSLNDFKEIGDYLDNGYKITEIERMFLKDFVVSKYKLTKLYQKVSEFIGLKNEIRDFPMPSDRYQRSVLYTEHIEVGDQVGSNDSLLTNQAIQVLMNPFTRTPNENNNKPVNAFVFDNKVVPEWDPEVFSIVKSATKFSGGNSMTFKFKFDDVKIGGDQKSVASEEADIEVVVDEQTGIQQFFSWAGQTFNIIVDWVVTRVSPSGRNIFDKPILKGVFYTDGDGRVYDFSFNLINDYEIEDATKLPLVRKADLGVRYLQEKEFRVYLEPAEILELSYTLNISSTDEDKFIVGKYFVGNNGLVKQAILDDEELEVVESTERYARNENKYGKGTVSTTLNYSTLTSTGFARFNLIGNSSANSWALRHKGTKELVFAVNQLQRDNTFQTISEVYVTPRKLKTGQVYANQPTSAILYLTRPYGFFVLDTIAAQLYVAWSSDETNIDFFEVGISDDLENWETVEITAQNYTFTNLNAGTTYTIRVRTHKDGEVSEYAYVTGTTKVGVPNVPINCSAVSYSSTRIIVSWEDTSNNEYAFEVAYTQDPANYPLAQTKILPKDQTAWSHDGLEPGQTWYYKVRARGDGGNSAYSNQAQASTPAPDKVATPAIESLSVSGNTLTYVVRNTHDQFVRMFVDVDTLNPSTIVSSQMPPNTTFEGTKTVNLSGNLYARAEAIFVQQIPSDVTSQSFILGQAPGSVTISSMERISSSEIRLQWSQLVAATGYTYRLMQGNTQIETLTTTTNQIVVRNFTGLTSGLTYTFFIFAYNQFGDGPESSQSLLLTADEQPPLAPDNLSSSTPASKTFRLNWRDNSSNETEFQIEWGTTSAYGNLVDNIPANTETWDVLTNVTGSIFIRLRAVGTAGASDWVAVTHFIAF